MSKNVLKQINYSDALFSSFQEHVSFLPYDIMTSETTKVQLESCHCCRMYDCPCLQSSSGDKKTTSSKLLEDDTNSNPETTWKPKETINIYLDSLMPPSQLPMELQDHQEECQTLKHGTCDIDLSGWEIT